MTTGDIKNFISGYLSAAIWSSNDEGGTPLDTNYSVEDIHPDTLKQMREDCIVFYETMKQYIHADNCPNANDGTGQEGMAGHDFWLTRNGHGAGFWDGDWPEPSATKLTNKSKTFGEFSLFVGDDNKLYHL